MADTNQDIKKRMEVELLELIHVPGVWDSKTNWLQLNHLWAEPVNRKRLTELVTNYLGFITDWALEKVLLYLDGVVSMYGVLPILGGVTSNLGCKLAIWRELGQVVLAEPWLLPSRVTTGLSCVVFQDVVGRGSTLLKSIDDLSRVNWSVTHFVCLVRTSEGRESLESSLSTFKKSKPCSSEFEFHSLIDARDFL